MNTKTISKKSAWINAEMLAGMAFVAAVAMSPAFGYAADDFIGTSGGACTFVKNIRTILNLISVGVVTIAIIFAGYQIAFAHKRIADVAPILIGGVLIGAAGQIAKMLVSGSDSCTASATQLMQYFA